MADAKDFSYYLETKDKHIPKLLYGSLSEKFCVIKGSFQNTIDVALKRYKNDKNDPEQKELLTMIERELAVLRSPQNLSEHFVRYYGMVKDKEFT